MIDEEISRKESLARAAVVGVATALIIIAEQGLSVPFSTIMTSSVGVTAFIYGIIRVKNYMDKKFPGSNNPAPSQQQAQAPAAIQAPGLAAEQAKEAL